MQEGTQKYELLYILPAKYTDEELKGMIDKTGAVLTGLGAEVKETHSLGRRKLEYAIKDVRNGDYVLVYFEAEPAKLAKINDTLRLNSDLLRHMTVKRDMRIFGIPSFKDEEPRRGHRHDNRHNKREVAPRKTVAPISMEDLDKKLDEILTEEVI